MNFLHISRLIFLVCVVFGADPAMATDTLSMDVTLSSIVSEEVTLKFDLKYSGKAPIEIYESDLPWGNYHSVVLVAAKLNSAEVLIPEIAPIDDPGPGRIEIRPGESLSGTIRVDRRFKRFLPTVAKTNLIVFWSYELTPISAPSFQRLSGALVIPKLEQIHINKAN
jgi:hypothetical protein